MGNMTDEASDSNIDIIAHQINLRATGKWVASNHYYGQIGSNPITIQLTGTEDSTKYLYANGWDLINIKSEGDLRVNRIQINSENDGGAVILNAFNDNDDASILNVRSDSDNNIIMYGGTHPAYTFTAEGSIGTSSTPFKIEARNDFLRSTSGGLTNLNVTGYSGTFLPVANSSAGGDYTLITNLPIALYRDYNYNTSIVTTNGGDVYLESNNYIFLYYKGGSAQQINSAGNIDIVSGGYVGHTDLIIQSSLRLFDAVASGDITINADNDVRLKSISAGGDVTITAGNNIVDAYAAYPGYTNITGTDVSLTALGTIGESIDNLEIEVSGALTIDSVGAIYIDSTSNLNINTINSDGAVNISTVASIVDANDDSTINITGTDVTLTAGVDIGESTDDLEVDYDEVNGTITTSAGGSVYVDAY